MTDRTSKGGATEAGQGIDEQGTKSYSYQGSGRFFVIDSSASDRCDGDTVRVEDLPEDTTVLKRIILELTREIDAMRDQQREADRLLDIDDMNEGTVSGLSDEIEFSVEELFAAAAARDNGGEDRDSDGYGDCAEGSFVCSLGDRDRAIEENCPGADGEAVAYDGLDNDCDNAPEDQGTGGKETLAM